MTNEEFDRAGEARGEEGTDHEAGLHVGAAESFAEECSRCRVLHPEEIDIVPERTKWKTYRVSLKCTQFGHLDVLGPCLREAEEAAQVVVAAGRSDLIAWEGAIHDDVNVLADTVEEVNHQPRVEWIPSEKDCG